MLVSIKQGRCPEPDPGLPVYLVHGEHEFLCSRWLARLAAVLKSRGLDDPPVKYDARETEFHTVLNEARTGSLFCEKQLIVVENAEHYKVLGKESGGGNGEKKSKKNEGGGGVEALRGYVQDPPPFTILVFMANETLTGSRKPREGGSVVGAALKEIEELGCVVRFEKIWSNQMPEWIVDRARELGLTLSQAAAAAFQERVGDDLRSLASELEKCAVYLTGAKKTIDGELIEAIVSSNLEHQTFRLMDLALGGKEEKAQAELSRMLADKEPPVYLLSTFVWRLRQLWQARWLIERGFFAGLPREYRFGGKDAVPAELRRIGPAETGALPLDPKDSILSQSPSRIFELAALARNLPLDHIERQIRKCSEIDRMMKGMKTRTRVGKVEEALQMLLLGFPAKQKLKGRA